MNQEAKDFLIQICICKNTKNCINLPTAPSTERNSTSEDMNPDEDEFEQMFKKAEFIRAVPSHNNNTL